MSRRSNLVLLAAAIALALLSTVAVLHRLRTLQLGTAGNQQAASVVVVTAPLAVHQVVAKQDVSLRPVPAGAAEAGVLTSLQAVVGHYTTTAWFPGQQVVASMVADSASAAAFPLRIPRGDVATSIPDDPVTGVDHLISMGDHVDVLVSFSTSNLGGPIVRTVLQNVLVLHVDNGPLTGGLPTVGSTLGNGGSGATSGQTDTITLAVTPKQAQQLDFAYSFGQLHVTLRNPNDGSTARLPATTNSGL